MTRVKAWVAWIAIAAGVGVAIWAADSKPKTNRTAPLGYKDTPQLPGQPWLVHDLDRPRPRAVTPGADCSKPPSDAIVLFDGKNLAKWVNRGKGGQITEGAWKVSNGYMEIATGAGDLMTREKFGSIQLHLEWASPKAVDGTSQWRGNSGVLLMNSYEIQVLDSYNNPTYADGQAGSIYGQWPPLVNVSRAPGEWQSYDIVFEAPKFEGQRLAQPAYVTVFQNGVLVHHRQEIIGRMAHRVVGTYQPHGEEEPLGLQDHDVPVRYRNIWVRRLAGYDQKEGS